MNSTEFFACAQCTLFGLLMGIHIGLPFSMGSFIGFMLVGIFTVRAVHRLILQRTESQ